MKGKQHTPDQVLKKLAESDKMLSEGSTVADVALSFGISEETWFRWENTYGPMLGPEVVRLKELEAENRWLKTIVADLGLDNTILKELA